MDGYHWQDEAVTRRDLGEAYREIVAKYSVDPRRVLIGGFSSGGYGTLVTLFEGTLPATGFVILCPEVPDEPSQAALADATRRGVRGTLLTTEQDGRLARQQRVRRGPDRTRAGCPLRRYAEDRSLVPGRPGAADRRGNRLYRVRAVVRLATNLS